MNSLLITELNEKKRINSNEKSLKPGIPKEKEEKKKNSYFLARNQKTFEKAKMDLMNYLIDNQSKYTNLEKAIEYYENQIDFFKKKINNNNIIIKEKHKLLKSMNNYLNEILIKNIVPIDDGKIEEKEDEKNKIRNEIETFNQALEMYKNIKSELQNENIMLKKDLNNEYIESLSRKNQYDKYKVIKNKIENEKKAQDHLYHTMNNFNDRTKLMFEEEENKKKNILTKEEYSLNDLKKSIVIVEEKLRKLNKKIQKKKKILPFEKQKNEKIIQDNKILIKENVSNYLKVNLIKKIYKLKNLDEIVSHVKKQNMQFTTKMYTLNNMLNDLTNLNIENTENEKEMTIIKKKIKEKLVNEGIIFDEPEIIEKIILLNGNKQSNILVKEKTYKKENFIKNIIRFIELYYPQFEKMIKSIIAFYLKIKEKSISKNNLEIIFTLFNNKNNLKDLKKYTSTKEYSKEDYKFILKIVLNFFRNFNYLYNNFIIDIVIQASKDILNNESGKILIFKFSSLSKEKEEEEIEKKYKKKEKLLKYEKKIDEYQRKNTLIKENITKEIGNALDEGIDIEELLKKYLKTLRERNEKKNYVPKKEDEFEFESYKEKKKNDKKRKKYNKENEKINEIQSLFLRLKMKFFLDLNKYTSDLVNHEDWNKKNKYKYNLEIRPSNKKKNIKNTIGNIIEELNRNKVEKKYNQGFINSFKTISNFKKEEKKKILLLKKLEKEKEENQVSDDTFIDENEYNKLPDIQIEKKIIKIQKNYFGYKSGEKKNDKEYKNILNLNKINVELFHKKQFSGDIKDFESIQTEFQKKLNMKIFSPIHKYFSPKRDYSNLSRNLKKINDIVLKTNERNTDKINYRNFEKMNSGSSEKIIGFDNKNKRRIYSSKDTIDN